MKSPSYEETVEGWRWGLKQAAGRLAYRVFPVLSAGSLEIAAARWRSSEIPQLFSRNLSRIDPSLNDDLLDLYGASEQVLANRFTFLNRAHQFPEEVNWQLPESPAWLGELHAFDFGLDLAMTYRISGEERYARHLRYLIAHWIAENPPTRDAAWLILPLARRMRNWILAADLARADWERDPEFLRIFTRGLALQCARLARETDPPRISPSVLERARALLLAGRFFGEPGSADLQAAALETIVRALDSRLHPPSDYVQTSPASELRLAATILEWLLFAGEGEESGLLKHGLQEISTTLEGILLPDGSLPLFGPPPREDLADIAALMSVVLGDSKSKALAGKFGILPYLLLGHDGQIRFEQLPQQAWKAESRINHQCGFYRLSGADSSALVIGPQSAYLPGEVDGADRATPHRFTAHVVSPTFELSIDRHRVIVNSGVHLSEGNDFSSDLADNVFLVDHQTPSRTVNPSQSLPQSWESGSGFMGLSWPVQGLASGGLTHQRAWYCLEGRFWVILDALKGRACHSGTSLLHFYPTFEVELRSDRAIAHSRALAVTVIPFSSPPAARMTVSRGDQGKFPGWYAPGFGIHYPACVLAFHWEQLKLPWVAGEIIIPGTEAAFHSGPPDLLAGTINLELSGRCYRLRVPLIEQDSSDGRENH